jgi:predicted TIM-barrel fold metal-dependent hydrolase
MAAHSDLWGELSYRRGIVNGEGKLTAEWRALFERFPDRFLIGSDTWINERWFAYDGLMNGYRAWLAQLPRQQAEKIANGNAKRLFGGKPTN